jgi:hypothetical protein
MIPRIEPVAAPISVRNDEERDEGTDDGRDKLTFFRSTGEMGGLCKWIEQVAYGSEHRYEKQPNNEHIPFHRQQFYHEIFTTKERKYRSSQGKVVLPIKSSNCTPK